jgi:hypothetical protein
MKATLTLAFALLLVCTGAALAQTPDGHPPSSETVCDAETGAAYGLCNAYCEAMDCDSDDPSASATACSKVASKFQNVTGRDVPCALACPCTSIPTFNTHLETVDRCRKFGSTGIDFSDTLLANAYSTVVRAPNTNPICGSNVRGGVSIFLPITPEEAELCYQLVLDAIASNAVTCD